jgi:hypothetical protein
MRDERSETRDERAEIELSSRPEVHSLIVNRSGEIPVFLGELEKNRPGGKMLEAPTA